MAKDKIYMRLINSGRWRALRKQVLERHPLCERCQREGLVAAATEVHHRQPVETAVTASQKERLMFDPFNLSPLCHRCHVATHKELGKGGRAATRARAQAQAEEFKKSFFEDEPPPSPPPE